MRLNHVINFKGHICGKFTGSKNAVAILEKKLIPQSIQTPIKRIDGEVESAFER